MLSAKIVADLPSDKFLNIRMLVPDNQWGEFCRIAHTKDIKPRLLLLEILQDYLRDYEESE